MKYYSYSQYNKINRKAGHHQRLRDIKTSRGKNLVKTEDWAGRRELKREDRRLKRIGREGMGLGEEDRGAAEEREKGRDWETGDTAPMNYGAQLVLSLW